MLISIVIDKCDQHTRNKWNESLDFKNLPNWKLCSKLLEHHCQYLQSNDTTSQGLVHCSNPSRNLSYGHNSSFAIVSSSAGHKLCGCPTFKSMTTPDRFETVKKRNLYPIVWTVIIESLSAHQGVLAAAAIKLITHHCKDIPAIEARPDSRADCIAK